MVLSTATAARVDFMMLGQRGAHTATSGRSRARTGEDVGGPRCWSGVHASDAWSESYSGWQRWRPPLAPRSSLERCWARAELTWGAISEAAAAGSEFTRAPSSRVHAGSDVRGRRCRNEFHPSDVRTEQSSHRRQRSLVAAVRAALMRRTSEAVVAGDELVRIAEVQNVN
jgi:hypothetical protein